MKSTLNFELMKTLRLEIPRKLLTQKVKTLTKQK